ncbi:hypothetical protein [Shivajiella indica]|uniref:Lipocalin-like domain-containing protein n=1 Tax=Shivajiella indica TaxID=872115 RepID=A0ABW5B413_9BACT
MKKLNLVLVTICLIMTSTILSCDDNSNSSPDNSAPILKDGTWIITNFNEDNQDNTNYFTGYSFDFQDAGVVKASSGSNVISGTWIIRKDSGKTKLDLNFGNVPKFEELNEDWEIITQSPTKMDLKDVSGGDGDISYLTFEKN